jgi:hypothetical protein
LGGIGFAQFRNCLNSLQQSDDLLNSRDTVAQLARTVGFKRRIFVPTQLISLVQQLQNLVLQRTNRGIWNLAVEISPEHVVIRGETNSFYAKQMAQESVMKVMPDRRLVNAIQVAA